MNIWGTRRQSEFLLLPDPRYTDFQALIPIIRFQILMFPFMLNRIEMLW